MRKIWVALILLPVVLATLGIGQQTVHEGGYLLDDRDNISENQSIYHEENWLTGVCSYTGPGADLPIGGYPKIPGWAPQMLVKTWTIIDAESDEGFAEKKNSELKANDIIIGCTMNASSIAKLVEMYGRDFYQVRDANGGPFMTLDEWQAKYHTNALGLVAIRNQKYKLRGE